MLLKLIRNVRVFRGGQWKKSDILVADKRIEAVEDSITFDYPDTEIFDGAGQFAVPGYIDQHVHVTGGGGEGSFITQVPPMKFGDPVKAGVTTIVGVLGTDGTTRSVANLVAKTKALNEFGLTAFCHTGNYNYPSPTLTGSVLNDIVFVDVIIGVKIAICDHRSANMTKESLIKLASDARVAGLLAGKPGIVHLHTGSGKSKLDMLFEIVDETDIPISTFRPTHLAPKYDDAMRWAQRGGFIDFTCDPNNIEDRAKQTAQALEEAPEGKLSLSTDSNGSMPIWNDKKEMIGIDAGKISSLHETIKAMTKYVPFEKAVIPSTANVAKALNMYPKKGCLAAGSDADIQLIDDSLALTTLFANGRCMMRDKEILAKAYFE